MVNIGHLLSGSYMNTALGLVSVAIAARALGPSTFGALVIIVTFCRLIGRIVRFDAWQALIKYAAEPAIENDPEARSQLYAFGFVLDIVAGLVAMAITVAVVFAAGIFFGIDATDRWLVAIFSLTLVTALSSVPIAVLRLANRFRLIAYTQLVGNLLRIPLALLCYWADTGLFGFVVAWTTAQIVNSLLLVWLCFRQIARDGTPSPIGVSLRGTLTRFNGILGFAFSTNLSSTLRTLTVEYDVLLVGGLAGPASAGFYHIAKRISKAAQQTGAQVQAVIYPDIARQWSRGQFKDFRLSVLQTQLGLTVIGIVMFLVLFLTGQPLLELVLGNEYVASYPILLVQVIAMILVLQAAPARSGLLAMGRARAVLVNTAISTTIFFAIALPLIPTMGAIGASIAHVALGLYATISLNWLVYRGIHEKSSGQSQGAVPEVQARHS